MRNHTVQIIICYNTANLPTNTGVWEIREIEVDKGLYDERAEWSICKEYYTETVVFVHVFSWME